MPGIAANTAYQRLGHRVAWLVRLVDAAQNGAFCWQSLTLMSTREVAERNRGQNPLQSLWPSGLCWHKWAGPMHAIVLDLPPEALPVPRSKVSSAVGASHGPDQETAISPPIRTVLKTYWVAAGVYQRSERCWRFRTERCRTCF